MADVPQTQAGVVESQAAPPPTPGTNLGALATDPTQDPTFKNIVAGEKAALASKAGAEGRAFENWDKFRKTQEQRLETANQQIAFDVNELKHNRWDADAQMAKRQTSLWEAFGSPAFIISMIGSAFSAMPMNTALQAGGAALNAIHRGDMESYTQAFDAWKENTELTLKRLKLEQDEFNNIVTTHKLGSEDLHVQLEAFARKFQNDRMGVFIQNGYVKEAYEAMEALPKLRADLEESLRKGVENEAQRKAVEPLLRAGKFEEAFKKLKELQQHSYSDTPTKEKTIERMRDEYMAKMEKEGKPVDFAKADQHVRRQVAESERVLPGGKRDELLSREEQYNYTLDTTIPSALDLLETHVGIAGAAGKATRMGEAVGNIFGRNVTARADFESLIEELRVKATMLLLDRTGRPISKEAAEINKVIRGLNMGDTTANTISSLERLRTEFTALRANLQDRLGQEHETPSPTSKSQDKWWETFPTVD